MGSETDDSAVDRLKVSTRLGSGKKNPGKVPRKIHKAAREKLKRDHMNDLFLDLENTLGLDQPNVGKASILRETIRLLGELLSQVDSLKKENVTLLSESNYVTVEKNELLEETSSLNVKIKSLEREIEGRANCSNMDVSQRQSNPTTQLPEDQVSFPIVGHASDCTPFVGPLLVMPLHPEPPGFPNPLPEMNEPKVPSSVSKPLPRYPSSSDSWPSHILAKQTGVVEDV